MGTEATLALAVDPTKAMAGLRQFERGLDSVGNATSRFAQSIKRDFMALGAIAGGAVVGLGVKAIKMAGDAAEIRSKFNVVFAGMEQDAAKWAEGFGDAVGRGTTEVQKHMAELGDMFKPLGYSADDALKLSKAVTGLDVDVASFNNSADADVIRDFSSALVGNHETVRKYGIIISEARLEQEAFEQGLNKSYKDLTDLEKVTLRYAILQDSSTDAMGDAVRTSDSYANQVKRLGANLSELGVELGDRLLPAANKALGGLNEWFTDNRSAINRWASDFKEGVDVVTSAMDKLHDAAFAQSSIQTMLEQFGPSTQKSILQAYKSQTGGEFGYQDLPDIGMVDMMPGPRGKVWVEPENKQYARKLLESYRRQISGTKGPAAVTPGGDGANGLDVKTLLSATGQADNEAARKQADAIMKSYIENLRFETTLVAMSKEEGERATIVRQAQAEATRNQTGLLSGHIAAIQAEIDALHEAQKMTAIGDEIGYGFARGFSQATFHAKSLKDALDMLGNAAMNVIERVSEITIFEPMAQSISRAIVPARASAMGDAFYGGRLQAFERGGLVDRPTLFGFAGGVGLMGEAGTEAIMPLRRGPSGRLGVEATGQGTAPTVYVNVENHSGVPVTAQASDVRFDGRRLIVGLIARDKRNNGPISRMTRRTN